MLSGFDCAVNALGTLETPGVTAPTAASIQLKLKNKAEWGALLPGQGNHMTRLLLGRIGIALLGLAFLLSAISGAQQKTQSVGQRSLGYDISREVSVQGSVINYAETSSVAPFGPHLTLQTSSGVLDVHLGNARLLESDHLVLAAGDAIRVVGENVASASGTQFLARWVQKGDQMVLLRNARGFPLRPANKSAEQRGAL